MKPIVLCILDGVGIGKKNNSNALFLANTPTIDYLLNNYPHSQLKCSGEDVGLPAGQMGNSEVGHLNMGAGRIVYQSLSLINKAIEDGSFDKNPIFLKAFSKVKENNSNLHLMGLLSDGGVHSHINHLKELIKMAKANNINDVYLHLFFDGRDVAPDSGINYLKDIINYCNKLKYGKIASLSGRYYAMDRDKRFERNFEAYQAMVLHEGNNFDNPVDYLEASYQEGIFDEFIKPAYNKQVNKFIEDNDVCISINFRPDRMIQLASLLTNPNYLKVFDKQPKNLYFVSMMKYDNSVISDIAFEHEKLNNVLGVYLANNDFKQLRIAETEKYAHVTFFFDGQVKYDGINNPELKNCTRILIDSPKVATYDLQPEMSAFKVKDALIKELDKDIYDVVILNFANGDMVGHTGKMKATIKALESVDSCLKELYDKIKEKNGVLLVTADHGNSELMFDEHKHTVTSHTTNPVFFIVTKKDISL
ncbi:MAG: 2,3-bisphosphoglycerate-independent phosphoglycerate mutase, partial [Bacilli bacterium]|nr:2,3-bisphosphoglycerate-independent phosphoglycerate mutase [Bacilli bacterium]